MNDQERLTQLENNIERMQAHHEALTAVVQAALPLLWDSPTFATNLKSVHEARMANRLSNPVSDNFISMYQEELIALLPSQLQYVAKQ